jgi:hypothetical protein
LFCTIFVHFNTTDKIGLSMNLKITTHEDRKVNSHNFG